MSETGYIILRDVPKNEARVDLAVYSIKGGFRGFQGLPAGAHYASVRRLADGEQAGFWCYVQPGEVVVKVLGYPVEVFEEADEDVRENFTGLAKSGAMGAVLLSWMTEYNVLHWRALTSAITPENFPPTIHAGDDPSSGSKRFDQALATHGGDGMALLAEFQFALASALVGHDSEAAVARWRHLTQALYHAGEFGIEEAPEMFPPLVDTLIACFKVLPPEMRAPDSFVRFGANYLAEDLQDMDDPALQEKGRALEAVLDELG